MKHIVEMSNKIVIAGLSLTVALGLSGCGIQPAKHATLSEKVQTVSSPAWRIAVPEDDVSIDLWWRGFGDPTLHALIDQVLDQNLDIKAAAERVKQAEAITVEQRAALLPELNASAQAADTRQITPPPLGYVRQAGAGVSASWRPDVFGGTRLSVLAAQAQLSGRRDLLQLVRVGMAANVASAYINLRWAQNEAQIENDNVQIRRRTLALIKRRLQYGLSTQLDVARAQNQLDVLQAKLPRTGAEIQRQLNVIAVYLGEAPEQFDTSALLTGGPIPIPTQALPQTLPSTALLHRPDVKAAYETVEQDAAEVGESEAQRYPQFRLNLTDGLLTASWLGLPTLTDNLFSAALSATSPIFNAGRITAQIKGSESKLAEAQFNLHQTMLQALKEIEDTRSNIVSFSQQSERLASALTASDQSVRLSNRLYTNGASSFLDVLSAQDVYLQDSLAVSGAQRDQALAAVALYRLLGGGALQTDSNRSVAALASEPMH